MRQALKSHFCSLNPLVISFHSRRRTEIRCSTFRTCSYETSDFDSWKHPYILILQCCFPFYKKESVFYKSFSFSLHLLLKATSVRGELSNSLNNLTPKHAHLAICCYSPRNYSISDGSSSLRKGQTRAGGTQNLKRAVGILT